MAEELFIPDSENKENLYKSILPQIEGLISGEKDLIANLANVSAALKQCFDFLWVGFYLVRGNELVLGPFQGPIACTRIAEGKGVCGTSWSEKRSIVVKDVELFPGHIACSSDSRSEIVVPGFKDGDVFLILDVDSSRLADFDEIDKKWLENLMNLLEKTFA